MLSQGVLVLNRHWTAVHVCSVRRALSLVVQDYARIVDENYQVYDFASWQEFSQHVSVKENVFIHTPSFRLLIPEVVLLTGFHRMPPRTVKFNRRNIYLRDHHTCQYCGVKPPKDELTIDHITPRCKGGRSTWENVVLACQKCNSRKGSKAPEDTGLRLRKTPKRPHWLSTLRVSLRGPERPIWQRFVDAAYWNVILEED
jgi:5-methylcytosine-specific restriction endonuclease McrA